jgi:hypothetical protein
MLQIELLPVHFLHLSMATSQPLLYRIPIANDGISRDTNGGFYTYPNFVLGGNWSI